MLRKHEDDIEELRLIPGSGGVFDVVVDGKTIFSKQKTNRFPSFDEIDAALR